MLINGTFTELNHNTKIIAAKIEGEILHGIQTKAYYEYDFHFWKKSSFASRKNAIQKHPYSYHLLYELEQNKHALTDRQMKELLDSFQGEITESKTFRHLTEYASKRSATHLDYSLLLPDSAGVPVPLLKKESAVTLIVLWASWCGPCRQEIPDLKELYARYAGDSRFRIVSLSVDTHHENWLRALQQENMP